MGGRLSIYGYNSTILQLINESSYMAEMYVAAAHNQKGDKKDLLLRLASEEKETALKLTDIYKALFCSLPQLTPPPSNDDITLNELITLETHNALHLAHIAKNAPNKELYSIYKAMSQLSINHSYLLLIILQ